MSMPQGQAPDINKLEDAPHRKAGENVRTPQKGRNGKLPPSSILLGSPFEVGFFVKMIKHFVISELFYTFVA